MSQPQNRAKLLALGLTLILVGYLTVWLPGPAAGLRLLGLELGEWIKFLGVGAQRDLFYLPPIALGLILALVTYGWDNRRWSTWIMRVVAFAVSLLAMPSIIAITGDPRADWLARVLGIGLVGVIAVAGGLVSARPIWVIPVAGVLGLAVAILPLAVYLDVRRVAAGLLGQPVGVGLGLLLTVAGGAIVALWAFWWTRKGLRGDPPNSKETA